MTAATPGALARPGGRAPLSVLVATVVHHPLDARIHSRQVRALVAAGHRVTYAAPFSAYGAPPPPEVVPVDLPRALGRRRAAALREARRVLADLADTVDLVLVHDPELLLALPPAHRRPPTVWDVHEDTAAAVSLKPWLPRPLRPLAAAGVVLAERRAEREVHLVLAEEGYRARFRFPHPVVPNSTHVPASVPPPGEERVVYLGSISRARGGEDMVELASLLPPDVTLELIGPADAATRPLLEEAEGAGLLRWHRFVPNDKALPMLAGALAGLSLLHDERNYRHSRPTKILEYMAAGVPVVSTPLDHARELVEGHGSGLVVPFRDPPAAAEAVLRLQADPRLRARLARLGRDAAARYHCWDHDAVAFVNQLEQWVRTGDRAGRAVAGGRRRL